MAIAGARCGYLVSKSFLTTLAYFKSRSDPNFGSTPLFQHAPHTPHPLETHASPRGPARYCVIHLLADSASQARGSRSSINNPELSLRQEHALGSFTFQCLQLESPVVDSNGLQPGKRKARQRERKKIGENEKSEWFGALNAF